MSVPLRDKKEDKLASSLSRVRDVAAIVHPQKINNIWGMGDIYLVNVGRQGIRCLLAVKNGVGVAT
jgi:hypothetical protein